MSLKLVSINVEQNKHLKSVRECVVLENPDVVALMEAGRLDLETIIPEYKNRVFLPGFKDLHEQEYGVVLASKFEIEAESAFYADGESGVPAFGMGTHRPAIVGGFVEGIKIYATHFTWTPGTSETEEQKSHLRNLLEKINGEEFVFCGDFNIPRGNSTYEMIVELYKDNIPSEVVTTIDAKLHKANLTSPGALQVVVDYVWSTPKYKVENVRVVSSVSDHCALVCEISKAI